MLDPKLLNDPNFSPLKTANREPPVDPAIRRQCPVRVLIPTQEAGSPVATWTDVAFAYVRELAGTELAPLIKVLSGDMGGIDLRGASPGSGGGHGGDRQPSRWLPYRHLFYGVCPQPGFGDPDTGKNKKTFVNVVIGAGDLTDTLWTLGAVNVLITGYGIPPYKVGWLPARAWDYDYIVAPSQKHADKLDELRFAVGDGQQEHVPVVIPTGGVTGLHNILFEALGKCAPESERIYL